MLRNVLKLRETMIFRKSSTRIGMKVSNRCSIIAHLPVFVLLPMKKLLFWKKMLCSANLILCTLAKCYDASIIAYLAAKFHIEPHDVVRSSVARIKDSFWLFFLN